MMIGTQLGHPRPRVHHFRSDVKSLLITCGDHSSPKLWGHSHKAAGSIKTFTGFVIRLMALSEVNCCFFRL